MINIFIIVGIILIISFIIGIVFTGYDNNAKSLTDDVSVLFDDDNAKDEDSNKELNNQIVSSTNISIINENESGKKPTTNDLFDDEII